MLKIKNITKKYTSDHFEQIALNNVSINFRKSEFVSILGQSGSGKTTLLNIIGGLDKYTSGDLIINGVSTKEYTDSDWDSYRNHSIGFVFQSYNLIGHQTVLSNVEMALTLSGVKKTERKNRAIQALQQVGLADHIRKKPNQLSGGQMQRVAIARALVNNPDIILADEPTGALDSDTSVQIMEILKNISKNKLVIMVTHNPELAEAYSTRIIRVKDGNVVGDTNPYMQNESAQSETVAEEVKSGPLIQRLSPLAFSRLDEKSIEAKRMQANVAPVASSAKTKHSEHQTSMTLLTALSLSLNNLMTKKGRTALTAIAGSIGIIGIALILAISTGVNDYINFVQKDTLSSYPIQIQKESTDMMALMGSLMETPTDDADKKDRNEESIYANPIIFQMLKDMTTTSTSENNLKDFKAFLEEHKDELNKYANTVEYGYDLETSIYAKDKNNAYVHGNYISLMKEVIQGTSGMAASSASSMLTSLTTFNVWQELITNPDTGEVSNLITDQYQLVHGKWPKDENEIVLVLNSNNEISDLTMYALGMVDKDTMMNSIIAALTGKKEDHAFEEVLQKSWSYDDIYNIPLKLVLPTDYYHYDKSLDLWVNVSNNPAMLNNIVENGLDLKITGVIKPKEGSDAQLLTGELCYTPALTKYCIEKIENSGVIKAQTSNDNANKNVLTGLPFVADETVDLTPAEKEQAFKEYVKKLTDSEKAILYENILANPDKKVIQDAVDNIISQYNDKTVEEIIEEMTKSYSAQLGYSPELIQGIFADYTKEELLEFLTNTVKDMLVESYKQSANAQIEAIKKQPSQQELTQLKDTLREEIFAPAYELPAQQQKAAKDSIKQNYIAQCWLDATVIPEGVVMSYLNNLSDNKINEIFEGLLTDFAIQTYAQSGVGVSDAENAQKVAEAFDKYLETCTGESLQYFYDNNMPAIVSDLSYKDLLSFLGYCTLEDPAFINIYPKDFEAKEKIAKLIESYNQNVKDEKDKIQYTDMVAMIMTSVSAIITAISVVLICFVSISLIVSSIMIGIITYISVLERTKEIGILRAVGASKGDISMVFNAETMIVGFLAGFVGIMTTNLICIPINIIARAITNIETFTAILPWYGYLLVVLSIGLTLIAGIFPAMMAAKKDPVIALRTE